MQNDELGGQKLTEALKNARTQIAQLAESLHSL